MIGKPPPTTKYSMAFERAWKAHPVGTKKAAWNAGKKAGFDDENWRWLEDYLATRHKRDEKWREGKFVPHLSTFINNERWEDNYKRISVKYDAPAAFNETPEEAKAKMEAQLKRYAEQAAERERIREMQKGLH